MTRRADRSVSTLLLLFILACTGRNAPNGEHPESIRLVGRYQTRVIGIEIARTPEEHRRGLSNRPALGEDRGMLFIFTDEVDRTFWMKETHFPLDIIFLDGERRIVGIVRRATPESEELLSVGKPSRYVLEVEGGLMDRIGMTEGDRIPFG